MPGPRELDEQALIGIYRATVDELYEFVSRRCDGERALAEDVTQETWLRAVREWRRTGVPDAPIAWLRVVARNLLLNHLRRRPALPLDEETVSEALATVEQESAAETEERAALLAQALARLPGPEAQLLTEFHFEHHRVAQLAERYGISERAVEGRLRRARERLRRELGKEPSFSQIAGGLA
jgi:RNA polymerase sigma-70 factor (ECF subfamily)